MAVNYAATLKSTRMQAVIAAIDAGAGPGTIEICSAAFAAVLAAITLADPSFTEAGGVITMAGAPRSDASADATGTAAVARIKDSNGVVVVNNLTVGVGSGEIQLNSTAISAGQTVSITSGTITHAP
jgi:hypothetical protein